MRKKKNIILVVLYAFIVIAELVSIPYLDRLGFYSIGFLNSFIIMLIIDIPIFVLIAIFASASSELVCYIKTKSNKKQMRLITASAAFAVIAFLSFVFLNSVGNGSLYPVTIISSLVSVVIFSVYLFKS